jgi:hypothetical protein
VRIISLQRLASRAATLGLGFESSGQLGLVGGNDVYLVDDDHEDRAGASAHVRGGVVPLCNGDTSWWSRATWYRADNAVSSGVTSRADFGSALLPVTIFDGQT